MKILKKVVLGTVQLGLDYGVNNSIGKPSKEKSFEILNSAYDHGIRTLDTADAYGNAVEIIGEFHREFGKTFEILTKFSAPPKDLKAYAEETIEKLGIQRINTLSFHSLDQLPEEKFMQDLRAVKSAGLIENIGATLYSESETIKLINQYEVDAIQLPFNLLDNMNFKEKVFTLLKSQDIEVHTRSCFLQGLFFMDPEKLPEKLLPLKDDLVHIQELSMKYHLSIAQMVFGYCMENDLVDKVLFGVESTEQLDSNLKALMNVDDYSFIEDIDKIIVKNPELLNPVNWK